MKALPLFLSALFLSSFSLLAVTPKEQVAAAQKTAATEKKDLLMIFAGLQWQKESQEFNETILQSEIFQNGSAQGFVPVIIDCPRGRAEAHTELLELQQAYRFREMPSVILTDAFARPYAYTGLRDQDPAAYVKHLSDFQKIRIERDRLFAEAREKNGLERAQLLVKGLKSMPQDIVRDFYASELASIAKADPDGETGYIAEIEKAEARRKEAARFAMLLRSRKYDEVIEQAKKEGENRQGEEAQKLKFYQIQALAGLKKFKEAAQLIEPMAKLAPESDYAKNAPRYLDSLKKSQERIEKMKQTVKPSTQPMVSKPVAIVSDIELLKKEAKEIQEAVAKAVAQEQNLKKANDLAAQKITTMEAELDKLRNAQKRSAEALKKASVERDKLARRSKAMKEVIENHLAMAQRKRDIEDLEKKAADLQKQAEELRKKAQSIKKGK